MSIEGFLLVGSLITALFAFVSLSVIASRTQRPAYKPVRVIVTRRSPNTETALRSDHVLK